MTIVQNFKGSNNVDYICEYLDSDSFDHLPYELIKQSYGVCFCENDLVIGFGGPKKGWGLIGGSIEKGESAEEALIREIKEESNMKITSYLPIGYQKVTDTRDQKFFYQLRYACKVIPYGEFTIDGGDGISEKAITEIKLINPEEYKKYFDWGEVGYRVMERAIELKKFL